jgi:stage III sporulation protein AD
MNDIGKIAAMAVAAALCAVVVRQQMPELAMVLALVAGAVILYSCVQAIAEIMDYVGELTELSGLSASVVKPVLKVAGIAIITRITAELCKDVKEGGLASLVEMAGTVFALITAIPLMTAVLSTLNELL